MKITATANTRWGTNLPNITKVFPTSTLRKKRSKKCFHRGKGGGREVALRGRRVTFRNDKGKGLFYVEKLGIVAIGKRVLRKKEKRPSFGGKRETS